jgi:hypothetical protein
MNVNTKEMREEGHVARMWVLRNKQKI